MCVDDNADVLGALRAALGRAPGIECIGCLASTRDLDEQVARLHPDLVILDYNIPGEDSMEALASLRRRHAGVACIVLSGYDDEATKRAASRAGASACLSKDIDTDRLVRAIREVRDGCAPKGSGVAGPVT
jgi:DNA-binding NarL/FixJ family response regulator